GVGGDRAGDGGEERDRGDGEGRERRGVREEEPEERAREDDAPGGVDRAQHAVERGIDREAARAVDRRGEGREREARAGERIEPGGEALGLEGDDRAAEQEAEEPEDELHVERGRK